MQKKLRLLAFLLFLTQPFFSQNIQLSVYSEISIITSGPGDNLYERFGHTAIRVKDPVLNLDVLYNYGIFDFNDPNFYTNFIKGYMNYKLARYPFHYALKSANQDERWVKQQVLNLTPKEKNEFFYFLENNAKPKNAGYLYDPFFDNCATRPRDIIVEVLKGRFILKEDFISKPKSLRTLMNEKIHTNSWGSFGINIALGNRLDKIATAQEYLYLPEYLFSALETSKIKRNNTEVNAISKTSILLDFKPKLSKADSLSPFLVFTILLIIVLIITYSNYKKGKRSRILDFFILFSTGLLGILILFLWFFTNHSTAPKNFNFLWGFAPNLIIAFLIVRNKVGKWIKYYIGLLLLFLILIPFIHVLGVQKFTFPIIPLVLLLLVRYLFLYTSFKKEGI
ncbi:lipoprotein N-acyltransferase Lnb domain-containing protein [Tenacibaculum amylolyticum]|uniref:lipoprotein N-acyltransferase Lnb domain-containing protein n=1 Tax=Tenacibaculum amylolyticum TaxID=104269 RepID=UPI0038B4D7E7